MLPRCKRQWAAPCSSLISKLRNIRETPAPQVFLPILAASSLLFSKNNGPHHCAGAHLSRRTVGVILLPMLFERFPNMTLPDPASVRWHGFGFRGPLNLPLLLQ